MSKGAINVMKLLRNMLLLVNASITAVINGHAMISFSFFLFSSLITHRAPAPQDFSVSGNLRLSSSAETWSRLLGDHNLECSKRLYNPNFVLSLILLYLDLFSIPDHFSGLNIHDH